MALIRWLGEEDSLSQFERMQQEFNRWLSAFGASPGRGSWSGNRTGVYPAMNLYDDGESYVVRAEIPGVDINQLELTVTGDTLSIKGERKLREVPENVSFHRREISSGKFRRSVTLPGQIDGSKVTASCRNGILEIALPRAEETKQRAIEIKAN